MNKFYGIGRTTSKPKLGDNGKIKIAKFNLAINRNFKNKEGNYESDFISCIAFNKTAELLDKYTEKGDKIAVEGRIQTGSYQDKQGNTKYTTDLVIDNVEFLESKNKVSSQAEPTVENEVEENPFQTYGNEVQQGMDLDNNYLE